MHEKPPPSSTTLAGVTPKAPGKKIHTGSSTMDLDHVGSFRVRVRVRRPAITRPDSKKLHLVHASAGSPAMAVAGLAGFTERPEAASPPSDPDAELTEALATSVDQLCTLRRATTRSM